MEYLYKISFEECPKSYLDSKINAFEVICLKVNKLRQNITLQLWNLKYWEMFLTSDLILSSSAAHLMVFGGLVFCWFYFTISSVVDGENRSFRQCFGVWCDSYPMRRSHSVSIPILLFSVWQKNNEANSCPTNKTRFISSSITSIHTDSAHSDILMPNSVKECFEIQKQKRHGIYFFPILRTFAEF